MLWANLKQNFTIADMLIVYLQQVFKLQFQKIILFIQTDPRGVSGIYITEIKSVRGGAIPAPPKKKGFFARFKKDKSAKNTTAEKTESKGKKNK